MSVSDEIVREVRSLPPGREMDREIAERVMGLQNGSNAPRYSSEMAAAWSVVEKMVRRSSLQEHTAVARAVRLSGRHGVLVLCDQ